MGHYADDTKFPAEKYGRNSNKKGVTDTDTDSAGGSNKDTQDTGGENDTVDSDKLKELTAGGANTGNMFAQHIYHNNEFEYSNFGGDGHEFMLLIDVRNYGINRNWWLLDNQPTCTL